MVGRCPCIESSNGGIQHTSAITPEPRARIWIITAHLVAYDPPAAVLHFAAGGVWHGQSGNYFAHANRASGNQESGRFDSPATCHISVVEDQQGKMWRMLLKLEIRIKSERLPPEVVDTAIRVNQQMLEIMVAGSTGESCCNPPVTPQR